MSDDAPDTAESDSPREQKRRQVQRHWFDQQPEKKQDEIIKPHFDAEHKTSEDVKKAVKDFEEYQ